MGRKWLYGKTVIISGASGGLGFAIAKLLIEKFDCKIIGIARNKEKLEKSIEILGDKKSNFSYRLFDVTVKQNWIDFKDYLVNNNIQPDILINNAGFMLKFAKFEKYSDEEVEEIIKTNFISGVNATKILLPVIKNSKSPAIINIASAVGLCPLVGETMYSATKYAMTGFTQSLMQDYRKQIYIAGVYPGFIKTDILQRMSIGEKEKKLIPHLMMPPQKAAKRIVSRIKRKHKRIVIGYDGHYLSGCARIFPYLTPTIVTKILKKSKLQMFDGINDD